MNTPSLNSSNLISDWDELVGRNRSWTLLIMTCENNELQGFGKKKIGSWTLVTKPKGECLVVDEQVNSYVLVATNHRFESSLLQMLNTKLQDIHVDSLISAWMTCFRPD